MSANPKDARDALRRLADALAEDVLNASDDEILQEVAEAYGDPSKIAADMLKLFEQTESEQGKARLAAAQAAAAAYRSGPRKAAQLDAAEVRRRYQAIINSPDARRTLAARKGEEPSVDDMLSALEDFEELGVVSPNDVEDPLK